MVSQRESTVVDPSPQHLQAGTAFGFDPRGSQCVDLMINISQAVERVEKHQDYAASMHGGQ